MSELKFATLTRGEIYATIDIFRFFILFVSLSVSKYFSRTWILAIIYAIQQQLSTPWPATRFPFVAQLP